MTKRKINRFRFGRAQIVTEYSVLLTVVAVAIGAMLVYIRRGTAAHLKGAVDFPLTVAQANFTTSQYEPDYYSSSSLSDVTSKEKTSLKKGSAIDASGKVASSVSMLEIINGTK